MLTLWFIALHMLGDYILQPHDMSQQKLKDWFVRCLHVTLYTFPFAVLGALTLPGCDRVTPLLFAASIFIPHFLVDSKRWLHVEAWPPKSILVDQTLHALHLAIVGTIFYGM